jgi:hypothetical protein
MKPLPYHPFCFFVDHTFTRKMFAIHEPVGRASFFFGLLAIWHWFLITAFAFADLLIAYTFYHFSVLKLILLLLPFILWAILAIFFAFLKRMTSAGIPHWALFALFIPFLDAIALPALIIACLFLPEQVPSRYP